MIGYGKRRNEGGGKFEKNNFIIFFTSNLFYFEGM